MEKNLKTDLWKKAYLIEFVDKYWGVLDAFTFSVPPESEEITYSQRKSETKTFGGLHVDDYGLDAVKISLSGSTINQDLKRIYRPGKGDKWLTGEEEIYNFRDLIIKHKSRENRAGEVKIMLYDLSKTKFSGGKMIKNYWLVFPGDFKIRRSSDRPFAYKYSIDFTAVDMKGSEINRNIVSDSFGWVKSLLNILDKGVKILEGALTWWTGITAYVDKINTSLRELGDIVDAYSSVLNGYIDATTIALDSANSILKIPRDMSTKVYNIGLEFMNSSKRTLEAVENMTGTIRSYIESGGTIPQEVLEEYRMTYGEYCDNLYNLCHKIENNANAIVAASKSSELPTPIAFDEDMNEDAETGESLGGSESGDSESGESGGSGGSESGDSGSDGAGSGVSGGKATSRQGVVLSYGYFEVAFKSTDLLESLAAEYCGNPEMAIVIAAYNGVASLDELSPGDAIKIPILAPSSRNSLGRIYSRSEDRNIYGRDIYLDSEGCTATSTSGDFLLTDGAANLSQAILLRLRESVSRRVRLGAYGIRKNVSDPVAGVAYILSSIDLTVRGDPRVSEILDIRFQGNGDGLDVTVDYTDINHANGRAKGRA
jgi:hypothetical protein